MGEVIRRIKGGKFLGWYLRFYDRGKRRVLASKQPSAAEARRMLVQIEARIARGEVGIVDKTAAPTVETLVARFLSEYRRPRIKDLPRYRRFAQAALRRVLPVLGSKPADAVTPAEIEKLRDTLSGEYAASSVVTTLAYLSAVYGWASRAGLIKTANPCRHVERPSREAALEFLSRQEVSALLSHAEREAPTIHPMVATAIYTGLRKGELCGLRWRDVDVATRRLTVARSYGQTPKSGKPRQLRLPERLVPLLAAWAQRCPKTKEDLVFPARHRDGRWGLPHNTSVVFGLPRLLEAAGCRVPAHPWHALRHTFASHFIMSGGNILMLQKILGHSDVKVTLQYAHLAPDYIAEEMNRLKF